ncbi:M16 family metallopeptidase [Puia sp. P3]|uniref:M16 family metallopeptidase n=1 Tax=Puia sp. P3 TaxID=3423952 RepID=UPI003D669228
MYLINKVGSVLEDNDQRGLAHFMEHMNFNGTKHFPRNELVDYLQRAGVRFGADLNAYTSFDETVYQLPLPTDDPSLVRNGLQIMRDWAREALLDSVEIEKERGVVLEEERLGKGAGDRLARKYFPVLLNHSRYAQRLPIGVDTVLKYFRPAAIRRFYHDWYRPDLQALIVVGDVDVDAMEKMVRAQFGTLRNPAPGRARVKYAIPLKGGKQFLVATDKENTSTSLDIYWKHPAPVVVTSADYLGLLRRNILNELLQARLSAEAYRQVDPAYGSVQARIAGVLNNVDAFAFSVEAKKGRLEQAFAQGWSYLEKVRKFGFTQGELDRAKQDYLRSMDRAVKEKDKTASVHWVKEYQQLFLHGDAAPGIVWEADFTRGHIGAITLDAVAGVLREYLGSANRDVIVMGPDAEKGVLPDSFLVARWMKGQVADLKPWLDEGAASSLLPVKPAPGKVVDRQTMSELGLTLLKLDNGVSVVLKPTDFKNDEIFFQGTSAGGTSLYGDSDYDAAADAAMLMGQFGAGSFDAVQLNDALNGKVARVNAIISARTQDIGGVTSPADLETALQLMYLRFTQPRKDTLVYNNIISRSRDAIAARGADPNNVFADTMGYVLGSYAYRASPPSLAHLQRVGLEKAYDIYRQRFADASGFSFVFVGSFAVDSIVPLLERYLGSLPSLHRKEEARDLGIHIPPGQLTKKVFMGTENKATVRLVISGGYDYSPLANLQLKALSDILQIKVLQHLREEEGEVYSPSVRVSYNKNPRSRYAFVVAFGCAPANADGLIAGVQKEMAALREQGPQEEDVQKFKAAYIRELEPLYRQNSFWFSYLLGQYQNGEDVRQVLDVQANLEKITAEGLRAAAQAWLKGDNFIRFELLPEGK